MAGDSNNASLWDGADVYIGKTLAATLPATADDPMGADWEFVGLLDGDEGFVESRDQDESDHYAWGGILTKSSRKNFKLTKTFTVLEDNPITRGLIWPGSTETKLIVPKPQPVKVCFELREGSKVKRLITTKHAVVDVDGDITENESDLTKVTLAAVIFPTSAGELFDRQFSAGAGA